MTAERIEYRPKNKIAQNVQTNILTTSIQSRPSTANAKSISSDIPKTNDTTSGQVENEIALYDKGEIELYKRRRPMSAHVNSSSRIHERNKNKNSRKLFKISKHRERLTSAIRYATSDIKVVAAYSAVCPEENNTTTNLNRKQRGKSAKVIKQNHKIKLRERPTSAIATIMNLRREKREKLLNMPACNRKLYLRELGWDNRSTKTNRVVERADTLEYKRLNKKPLQAKTIAATSSNSSTRRATARRMRSASYANTLHQSVVTAIPVLNHVIKSRFNQDIDKIEALWEELHIPQRDKDFFRVAYMRDSSHENAVILTEQLTLLKKHKHDCINVLLSIKLRNNVFFDIKHHIELCYEATSAGEVNTWRQHMSRLCKSLRKHTCEIIENVIDWREHLWRPLPFLWKSKNILICIKNETEQLFHNASSAFGKLGVRLDSFEDLAMLLPREELHSKTTQRRHILRVSNQLRVRLSNAAVVLNNESKLQQRVLEENSKLVGLGYYIPTLRWTPDQHGLQRWSNYSLETTCSNTKRIQEKHNTGNSNTKALHSTHNSNNKHNDNNDDNPEDAPITTHGNWHRECYHGGIKLSPTNEAHVITVYEEGLLSETLPHQLYFQIYNSSTGWVGEVSIKLDHPDIPPVLRQQRFRLILIKSLISKIETIQKETGRVMLCFTSIKNIQFDSESNWENQNLNENKIKNNLEYGNTRRKRKLGGTVDTANHCIHSNLRKSDYSKIQENIQLSSPGSPPSHSTTKYKTNEIRNNSPGVQDPSSDTSLEFDETVRCASLLKKAKKYRKKTENNLEREKQRLKNLSKESSSEKLRRRKLLVSRLRCQLSRMVKRNL